jgi:O-antigen/teichoic acid export membrane protein
MESLKRNVIANYVGQAYAVILNIATVPIYIRLMGAEAYGLIGFFAFLQVWFQLLDFGLSQTLAREVARYCGGVGDAIALRTVVKTIETVFLGLSALSGGLIVVFSQWIAEHWLRPQELQSYSISASIKAMGAIVAIRLMVSPYRGLLMGFEKQLWLNAFTIVTSTSRVVAAFICFRIFTASALVFFLSQLAVAVLEAVILSAVAHRALPTVPAGSRIKPTYRCLHNYIGFTSTIAFTASIWLIVTYSDRVVLSKLLSLSEFGYFTAAATMAFAVTIVASPASNALVPRLTKLSAAGRIADALSLYRVFTRWVCSVAFPVGAVLACFPERVLWVWTGNAQLATYAARPLVLYAIGNAIFAASAFPYYLQLAKGDLTMHLYGNIVLALVIVPAIIYAGIHHGASGTAAVWLAANLLYLVLWIPLIHKRLVPRLHLKWLLNDVAPHALLAFIVSWLLSIGVSDVATRFGGAVQLFACWIVTLVATVVPLMRRGDCAISTFPDSRFE